MFRAVAILALFSLILSLFAPQPSEAQAGNGARIIELVRESQSFEAANNYSEAADRLDTAIELLNLVPAADGLDAAVLGWRRAWLRFRSSQSDRARDCKWPITEILALAQQAADLAVRVNDAVLRTRTVQLHAAVALAAGEYHIAETLASEAAARLVESDPCAAAASQRLRFKAALLTRRLSVAGTALRTAEALTLRGQCPSEEAMENAVLDARLSIASADYDAASKTLARLEEHPTVAATPKLLGSTLYNAAEIALMRGNYAEAEILNEQARAAYRKTSTAGSVFGQIDQRAAIIRQELGDFPAAEKAYGEALEGLGCALGGGHPITVAVRRERVRLMVRRGETDAAVAEVQAVVAVGEDNGLDPHARALNLALLGLVLHEAGRDPQEAATALQQGLAALGETERTELDRTPSLTALAEIALDQGRISDAKTYATAAIEILKANASDSVQRLGRATRIMAAARAEDHDHIGAMQLALSNRDRILAQLAASAQLATYTSSFAPEEIRAQTAQMAEYLWRNLDRTQAPEDADELFRVLQIVHLAGGVRGSSGLADAFLAKHPDVAETVTEERALLGRIEGYERMLRTVSDHTKAVGLRGAVQDVRRRIDALRSARPDNPAMAEYRLLTSPRVLGLGEARGALEPGQSLWLQASFDETTFTFLLTTEGYRAVRTEIPAAWIEAQVFDLRAAVDLPPGVPPDAERFPDEAAHALYCVLFGRYDDDSGCSLPSASVGTAELTKDDELFLLPDRAMQQMAMGVLLARPLDDTPSLIVLRDAAWLARRHPHQTAPTVTAFAERNRMPKPTDRASRAFVAFAPFGPFRPHLCDPERQVVPVAQRSDAADERRFAALVDPERAFRQARLPMTVELLRNAADDFGAVRNRDWFECEDATEASVKRSDLSSVDILLFATHAEVGNLPADLPEPGLFFSAPAQATALDDGYLKASEIAQMKIGAEIVVLSACSTGSDSGLPGASGLSGLARAFFEAGAAQLIVSHWDVAAVSSSALFQSLLANRRAGSGGSLAVELQRAMLDVMDGGHALIYAHPFVWAPFTVVVGR